MKHQLSIQFLENGKEIESHPDEEHHEIVVHLDESDVPITICDLPLSAQCDDMKPDGMGGSCVAASYHVTPAVMVKIGRSMANALEYEECLEDLRALAHGAKLEHLDLDDLIATMLCRIEKVLP
jgi:hypothetical protein